MRRLATISWLLDRQIPWLPWWQELILNWVASWSSIGTLLVTSSDNEHQAEWDVPTDLVLASQQLDELLQ
jgi:hypothetical protein